MSKSGCEKRTLELVLPESDEVLIKNVAVDANPKGISFMALCAVRVSPS